MKDIEKRIIESVEKKRCEIIEFVRSLIKYQSVNEPPTGRELECQKFIAKKLKELDLKVDMFTPDEVGVMKTHPAYAPCGSSGYPRIYENRPNVVGVWKSEHDGRSIILNGHVDVFPVMTNEKWIFDPWAAKTANGMIYGRGASDMKGGLGAMLMAMECLQEAGIKPKGDIIFESVVDEEFGGGNGTLATILKGYQAHAAICGEPSELRVCPVGYGGFLFDVKVKGKNAHPFYKKQGVNAIDVGIKIVEALKRLENNRSKKARETPLFSYFDPACPIMIRSFNTGEHVGGGLAPSCTIRAWIATLPNEQKADVLNQIANYFEIISKDFPILEENPPEVSCLGRYLEPWITDPDDPFVETLKSTVQKITRKGAKVTAGLTCDAFLFSKYAKIPTVIFGPGSALSAHNIDESISIHELVLATKIYALTIYRWCNS
ncbi:MAG: ArgE/DapE family deacylase [Candidatus Bathyarchaeia archaeon]